LTGQRSPRVEHAQAGGHVSSRLRVSQTPLARRYVAAMLSIPLPFEKTGRPVVVPIRVSDPVGSGPGTPLRSSTCNRPPRCLALVSAGNYVT
jgi:hypothetical protein